MNISNQNNLSFQSKIASTPTVQNALEYANHTVGEKYTRRVIDGIYKSMRWIGCDGKKDVVEIKCFSVPGKSNEKMYASFISGQSRAFNQFNVNALNTNAADLNAISTILRNLAVRLDPHFYPDTLFAPSEKTAKNQLEKIKKLLVDA